jgi:hypothetical protein
MGPGSHVGFPISAKNKNLNQPNLPEMFTGWSSTRVHNVFSLAEILKIFLSETTKSIRTDDGRLPMTKAHGLWPGELIKMK